MRGRGQWRSDRGQWSFASFTVSWIRSTCNPKLAGIRFFCQHVLGREDFDPRVPAKRSGRLPEPLGRGEVERLIGVSPYATVEQQPRTLAQSMRLLAGIDITRCPAAVTFCAAKSSRHRPRPRAGFSPSRCPFSHGTLRKGSRPVPLIGTAHRLRLIRSPRQRPANPTPLRGSVQPRFILHGSATTDKTMQRIPASGAFSKFTDTSACFTTTSSTWPCTTTPSA